MFSALYWSPSWAPELTEVVQSAEEALRNAVLRRARGYFLYFTQHRLLDLYLDAGQALCGYRPAGTTAQIKNTMARGLYAVLPAPRQARLDLLLHRLFPGLKSFRLYHSLAPLQAVFSSYQDLLCIPPQSKNLRLWRPFQAKPQDPPRMLIPVLSLSTLPLPYLVLSFDPAPLPPSDVCSPLQFEALIQALGQTEGLLARQDFHAPVLEDLRYRAAESPQWLQDGIYLYWQGCYSDYALLWRKGLAQGFLLPPNPYAPCILGPGLLQDRTSRLTSQGKYLQHLLI